MELAILFCTFITCANTLSTEEAFAFLRELQRSVSQMTADAKRKSLISVIQRLVKMAHRDSSRK